MYPRSFSPSSPPVRQPGAAVFLHSGWRCSSTYVWDKFRRLPGVEAFYEPHFEHLATLTPEAIHRSNATSWKSRHPPLDRPYRAEFEGLLRPEGGVAGYDPAFALASYFPAQAEDEAQEAYTRSLLDRARQMGATPVLGCCRTLGRVGWMKRRLGGIHVVLVRDPLSQWWSGFSHRKRGQPSYFELCAILILALSYHHPMAAQAARRFGIPQLEGGDVHGQLDLLRQQFARLTAPQSFEIFLTVWGLSYIEALPEADTVMDVDLLGESTAFRSLVEWRLASLTGLSPSFADCRTPRRDDALPQADAICERVLADLLRGGVEEPVAAFLRVRLSSQGQTAADPVRARPLRRLFEALRA